MKTILKRITHSHSADKLRKIKHINQMKDRLVQNIEAYNQIAGELHYTELEIAEYEHELTKLTSSSAQAKIKEKIHNLNKHRRTLDRQLHNHETRNLRHRIQNEIYEIKKLEIEVFGESHPHSPSFLMQR